MSGVLVLNADLSVLADVGWQRAVTLLLSIDTRWHEHLGEPGCLLRGVQSPQGRPDP